MFRVQGLGTKENQMAESMETGLVQWLLGMTTHLVILDFPVLAGMWTVSV